MAGHTIGRDDWPDARRLIQRERAGEFDHAPKSGSPPIEGEFAKAVRCVLLEDLSRGGEANAERIRTLSTRATIDVRLIGPKQDFVLKSLGKTSQSSLSARSTDAEIQTAVESLGLELVDILRLPRRWLITVRVESHDRLASVTTDRPAYEVGVDGLLPWSLDGYELTVVDPYDRLPPDAVDDGSTLIGGSQARLTAGLIGTAMTGVNGEYFFMVPHFYESVTARPIVIVDQCEAGNRQTQSTAVAEIMHVEIDDQPGEDGEPVLPDEYNPAEVYESPPSSFACLKCRYVPTATYVVVCNPRPNYLLDGFYMAYLTGRTWVVDNQATWVEHF